MAEATRSGDAWRHATTQLVAAASERDVPRHPAVNGAAAERSAPVEPRVKGLDATLSRLDDEIAWYDRKSLGSQRVYKMLKIAVLLAAAAIPILASVHAPVVAAGVLMALLEGIQHLNQYRAVTLGVQGSSRAASSAR